MLGCAWVGRLKGAKFSSVMAARRPSRTVRVEQVVSPLFDADQLR